MKLIYLDWAATAPILKGIPALMSKSLLDFQGNPSSIHSEGKKAREQINIARKTCADLLEIKSEQLVFTSGGTESNSIILSSLFRKNRGAHIILSAIEHPSIYEYYESLKFSGFDIDFVKPDSNGIISPDILLKLLKPNTVFVSIMAVNNETGAIQAIDKLAETIRIYEKANGRSIHFHTDAVQALGKIPFKPGLLNINSASFSAHKIGGPKGIGMLYLQKPVQPLSAGGGQEFSIRPGTENTAGIIALARAMDISLTKINNNFTHAKLLKDLLITELLKIKGVRLLFDPDRKNQDLYSPYITSITVSPVPGEVLVRILSDEGIQVSTGSACSSRNRKKQMRILLASDLSEQDAAGSIRISIGWSSTESNIINFVSVLKRVTLELRKYHK
ncbi:MAG: cysteine desulfurase [Spirochaetaceae bacterium]|nr:cysteine desulfurase [Spirochaetaceae bacterium]